MTITYLAGGDKYVADTCEPLKAASDRKDVTFEAIARGHYPGKRVPDDVLPGLKSVGFWDAPREQSWGLDWHRNEGIEITCVTRGKLAFSVESQEFDLKKGSVTITRPWQRHRVGRANVNASRLHWLILDLGVRRPNQRWEWPKWVMLSKDEINRLTDYLQYNEHPVWSGSEKFCTNFETISSIASGTDKDISYSALLLSINQLLLSVLELMQECSTNVDDTLTSSRRSVELFLDGLEERLEESWTLDRMSAACGMARTQFSAYCRDITNMTPMQYLRERRVKAAKALLVLQDGRTITDIAALCGFESSQYFANVFKHSTGVTPSDFARQQPNETGTGIV